jgi:DNA-directed RNA polymerase subunit H
MNFEYIDYIYRSRITLLDILEARGYNVDKYRKFSPAEISLASESFPSLSFKATKRDDETKVCDVRYAKVSRVKDKIDSFFDDIEEDDIPNTEVIVMMMEPLADIHHITARKQYIGLKEGTNEKKKLRVAFFSIPQIVVNPLKHVLVPKHEIVPQEQHKDLLDSMYITSKAKLPEIQFHIDPITRCIGAVPGDIIKITRSSPSSGETIIYRICV